MNAHINDFCDCFTDDDLDFVFGPDTSYPVDSFDLHSKSKDNVYNTFGLSLVEMCWTLKWSAV